jgi:hypothetical protein
VFNLWTVCDLNGLVDVRRNKIMAKLRSVNTSIWVDDFIVELDPTEKLLFMYLLINPFTRLSGCYKLTIRQMAFDTGIDSSMVLEILNRFETQKKVIYRDGWIFLPNFLKNQNLNENMRKNVASELNDAPEWAKSILATIIESSETLRNAFKGFETLRNASKREVEEKVEVKVEIEREGEVKNAHASESQWADEIAEALFDNPKPVKPVGSDKFFHECNQGLKDRLKTPARLPDQGKWLQVFQFWLDNEQTSENFLAIFDLKDEIRVRKKEKWTISPSVMEKSFGKLESLKLELKELNNGGNGNGANQPNYKSALERREESKLIEINAIEQIRTRVAERNRERNVPRTNSLGS